jgi:hypothetical protein
VVCWPIAVCSCAIHGGVACAMWRRAGGRGGGGAPRGGGSEHEYAKFNDTPRRGVSANIPRAPHTSPDSPTLRLCDSFGRSEPEKKNVAAQELGATNSEPASALTLRIRI